MKPKESQTFFTALLLSICGGYLDAYTYFSRGGVFANAQTGNIIKFGLQIAAGNSKGCLRYLIPILSFCSAILVALAIESFSNKKQIHIVKRGTLILEIILLFLIGHIQEGENSNLIANTLVSFVCALQMQIFSKFEMGNVITTVSTGNLRKALENSYQGITQHNQEKLLNGFKYGCVVFSFIAGVIIGTWITAHLGVKSVYIVCFMLMSAFAFIHFQYKSNFFQNPEILCKNEQHSI